MKVGIIGAMASEVALLKEKLNEPQVSRVAGMEFCQGSLGGTDVVVVQSGIGKVNAGICVQILVDRFGVGHVINTGVAGSLDDRLDIGDLVVSTDCVWHDFDATPRVRFPASEPSTSRPTRGCARPRSPLPPRWRPTSMPMQAVWSPVTSSSRAWSRRTAS